MAYYQSTQTNRNASQVGGSGGNFYGSQQQQPASGSYQQPSGTQSNSFHQEYGDVNTWQQQQQHQPQQPYGQQQQQPPPAAALYGSYPMQQQHPSSSSTGMNSFWDPSTAAKMAAMAMNMSNNTSNSNNETMMLNLAGEASKSLLQSKSAQLLPGYMDHFMFTLRSYFAVDNQYVLIKMKRILFPFLYKHWKRQQTDPSVSSSSYYDPSSSAISPLSSSSYQVPIYDDCAPDLYIPIMSGITYVLIASFLTGTVGKFNPQMISSLTTYCLIIQLLEVATIKFGCYTMHCPIAILDLFSYTGYKYFGLCWNMIIAMMIGRHGLNLFAAAATTTTTGASISSTGIRTYYICYFWTASTMSYFMLKTMANHIPLSTASSNYPHQQHAGPKREIMVLLFAASQFITMWLMSQTKFL